MNNPIQEWLMHLFRKSSAFTVILVAFAPIAAMAQDSQKSQNAIRSPVSSEAGGLIEEVIVTARRKEESAQDISVAVTAFKAEILAEQGLSSVQDLAGHVPSFSVTNYGQNRMVENITIRGQGSGYLSAPAVVQYMAEVPLIAGKFVSVQGGPGMFFDLSNVQILRGPQGTLFGRNSTGGTVLLEPTRPGNEFGGYVQGQVGNYDHVEFEGAVDIPLAENLHVRLGGNFADREGFTDDVITGQDYDDDRYHTGRIGINWTPTDTVENYFFGFYSKGESNGTGYVLREYNEPYIDDLIKSYGFPNGCADIDLGDACSGLTQLANEQQARDIRHVALGPPDQLDTEIENWMVLNQFSLNLSDNLTLRNILSYGELKTDGSYDGDGSILNWYDSYFDQLDEQDDISQFTAELQVQGRAFNDNVEYTTGVYYEKVKTPGNLLLSAAPTFTISAFSNGYSFESESTALYTQIDLDIGNYVRALEGLKLTGGIRYTWDSMDGSGVGLEYTDFDYQTILACGDFLTFFPDTADVCAFSGKHDSDSESWTLGLEYMMNDGFLGFAKVSKGYKTGGINFSSVNPANRSYEPEYLITYEAGFKSTFNIGDIEVLFNAAAFLSDYEDIQVAADDFDPVSLSSGAAVYNAAEAEIKGFEAETVIRVSPNLELSGNFSHMQGDYDDFVAPTQGQFDCSGDFVFEAADLSCQKFPYIPKSQYSLATRYTLPLEDKIGELVVSGVYAYTGDQYGGTTQLPEYQPDSKLKAYGLLNLSLNWYRVMSSNVDASVFITNALDKEYILTLTGVYQSLGVHTVTYGEPRMYGLKRQFSR